MAYRSDGALHVLDAHCRHLGAHLWYGRVQDDCVVCPFHGWHWTPMAATATFRIRRTARTNPAASGLRPTMQVSAQHGHHLTGGGPNWSVPDIFTDTAGHTAALARIMFLDPRPSSATASAPCIRNWSAAPRTPSTSAMSTNSGPSGFFICRWEREGLWFSQIGFGRRWIEMQPDSHDGDTLSILLAGVGMSYTSLSEAMLILLSTTPIDDTTSELFQTVWLEQLPEMEVIANSHRATAQLPNDIRIWEHQRFEDPPALATRGGTRDSYLPVVGEPVLPEWVRGLDC